MLIVYKSIYFLYPSPCSADGSELNLTHACRVFPSPTLGLSPPLLALPGGAGLWGYSLRTKWVPGLHMVALEPLAVPQSPVTSLPPWTPCTGNTSHPCSGVTHPYLRFLSTSPQTGGLALMERSFLWHTPDIRFNLSLFLTKIRRKKKIPRRYSPKPRKSLYLARKTILI